MRINLICTVIVEHNFKMSSNSLTSQETPMQTVQRPFYFFSSAVALLSKDLVLSLFRGKFAEWDTARPSSSGVAATSGAEKCSSSSSSDTDSSSSSSERRKKKKKKNKKKKKHRRKQSPPAASEATSPKVSPTKTKNGSEKATDSTRKRMRKKQPPPPPESLDELCEEPEDMLIVKESFESAVGEVVQGWSKQLGNKKTITRAEEMTEYFEKWAMHPDVRAMEWQAVRDAGVEAYQNLLDWRDARRDWRLPIHVDEKIAELEALKEAYAAKLAKMDSYCKAVDRLEAKAKLVTSKETRSKRENREKIGKIFVSANMPKISCNVVFNMYYSIQ